MLPLVRFLKRAEDNANQPEMTRSGPVVAGEPFAA